MFVGLLFPALLAGIFPHPVLDFLSPDLEAGFPFQVQSRFKEFLTREANTFVVVIRLCRRLRMIVHEEIGAGGRDLHALAEKAQGKIDVLETDEHAVVEAPQPVEGMAVQDGSAAKQERAEEWRFLIIPVAAVFPGIQRSAGGDEGIDR